MTAIQVGDKTVLTRGHFAAPTIGVKADGTYEGLTKDFYKQHGTEKPDGERGQSNAFNTLAALDPSPFDHVAAVYERKLLERKIDPRLQPGVASAWWDWAEKAATLERHLLACSHLQDRGGLRYGRCKDFLGSADSAALFPAYVESQIAAGMLEDGLVADIVMGTSDAGSTSVLTFEFKDDDSERSTSKTSMGSKLPRKTPTTGEGTITLSKYGMAFPVPYEMRRTATIDVVAFHIRRIGQQIAIDQTDEVMHRVIAGDGSGRTLAAAETNATDTDVAVAGTVAYSDMLTWCYAPAKAYRLDLAVGGKTDLALIANLAEFKDPDVSKSISRTGFKSPLNIRYEQWDGGVSGSSYVNRLVVGFDTRNAMRAWTWGPNIQETDRLIEDQLEVFTFSHYFGVEKVDMGAIEVLDCNSAL